MNKRLLLIEPEHIDAKRVHWGVNNVVVIPRGTSGTKRLKHALEKANLSEIKDVLQYMDSAIAKEQLTRNYGTSMKILFESFHNRVLSGAAYESTVLKEVLQLLFSFCPTTTNLAFYSVGAHLKWNKNTDYAPQIRGDYESARREFELFHPEDTDDIAPLLSNSNITDIATGTTNVLLQTADQEVAPLASQEAVQGSQRSITANEQTDNEADYTEAKDDEEKNLDVTDLTEDVSLLPSPSLTQLYAWIAELPAWLQEQILNSSPVKALIESVNQAAAIYNMNSLQDFITQATPSEPASNSAEVTEEDMWQKAQVYDPYPTDAIDMTMIWKEPAVSGWIMPMIGMESGTMFFDNAHAFNDLPHHGYGVDVF